MNAGYEYHEQVGPEAEGRSVLAWLALRHVHSSAAEWARRIERGEVRVDGAAATAGQGLRRGQRLSWRRPPWEEPPVPLAFAVLFRDEDLLAVAKPRGLPSVPNGGFLEHTLLHRVRRVHPEAVPLHRLGRGTSGLVLFARTPLARRRLAAAWREGRVVKEYRALVAGAPGAASFAIATPIGLVPHPRLGRVHAAAAAGRPAVSQVEVLACDGARALVAVRILTGRPHQIRIHLAAAGHPLVGDPLYASGGLPGPDPALPGQGGYRLHARRLAFEHPRTGRPVELVCSPPPDLLSFTPCSQAC
jgi:23S rRNA pseudouridine1911/1915/1917 synthase